MINDTQDVILKDVLQASYLKKIAEKEKPDLIVMAGDLLTDFFPGATKAQLKKCLTQALDGVNALGVPFVATFGNHDHDLEEKVEKAVVWQIPLDDGANPTDIAFSGLHYRSGFIG